MNNPLTHRCFPKKSLSLSILLLLFSLTVIAGEGSSEPGLIDYGDTWKYLDNEFNQGTTWRNSGFNDANWSAGAGQLGFGDSDEATVITSEHTTYYFRKEITIADTSATNSTVNFLLIENEFPNL